MRWRLAVVIAATVALGGVLTGFAAYHTPTLSFDRTEVLTGWACVRYVAFTLYPLFVVAVVGGGLLFVGALSWAFGGDRS